MPRALLIGDFAPNFTAQTTQGFINFHNEIEGSWTILFSHPRNFTPICTTELGYVAKIKPEFDKRGVKIFGLSVDRIEDHGLWEKDIEETQGCKLNYPLIADHDAEIAAAYGMIHPNASDTSTVRSIFIIDPNKKIKVNLQYPTSTGRNFDEILRIIDSLQLTEKHSVATPVNWKYGDDVIIAPSVSNAQAKEKFPQGWVEQKPYLRITKMPKS
jgi:alkyl hydroperoxide reductase subunit AhpC